VQSHDAGYFGVIHEVPEEEVVFPTVENHLLGVGDQHHPQHHHHHDHGDLGALDAVEFVHPLVYFLPPSHPAFLPFNFAHAHVLPGDGEGPAEAGERPRDETQGPGDDISGFFASQVATGHDVHDNAADDSSPGDEGKTPSERVYNSDSSDEEKFGSLSKPHKTKKTPYQVPKAPLLLLPSSFLISNPVSHLNSIPK